MNFDQCACSGKTLGRLLQPAVMGVLAEEPAHGYRIAARLRAMAMCRGQRPDPTGVYRLLKSMEDDGLVVSSWDLAATGPARRRYHLTARGRACLVRWTRTLQVYEAAIAELLEVLKPAAKARRRCACGRAAVRPSAEVGRRRDRPARRN